ncbi:MAG TPA: glycoside hydrolase TIM-barrel-like domain-containing protein [Roseiarcus sp.]|nr:glycoside hydrolase TIM-barrel-like domain-containing protein [Roseiarcus sp.]
MGFVGGVHLLPATGEFAYDTIPHQAAEAGGAMAGINTLHAPGGAKTDYSYAIDQLQAAHPECGTVSILCAWFADSLDAASCRIYPSTNFIGGVFQQLAGSSWTVDSWRVSGLTQSSSGLIPLPTSGGGAIYGGTPSDQSVVRCIQDLKARGFKVVFYPFLLTTAAGLPWRGRIAYAPDLSSAATDAVDAFLGPAAREQFTPDAANLTVAYAGSPTDFTYRRMILHYAWLCALAGGVNLFLLGSELRGLETIRGPSWTKAGTTDGSGYAVWDYPFVAGLQALAADVRAIFDGQGLAKDAVNLDNLIAYSADWSAWMGYQHPGEGGQWPHLDQLFAAGDVDLVGIDNYLPLTDWTTGEGGLDALNWSAPARSGPWPPASAASGGLGLSGPPALYSLDYIKANIEGGEKYDWYYNDGVNGGRGLDPNGSDRQVSLPQGDRLIQARNAYSANQQLLANKQFRWWWSNPHQAVYDSGDGQGWAPHGPQTQWRACAKPLAFIEYGFPAADKATNQPNVFFDSRSSESATPYWSLWAEAEGGGFLPQRDDTLMMLALQAVYEYWNGDGHNETSPGGVKLIEFAFSCVWAWDARPFPTFPLLTSQWSDGANWFAGNWLSGRGPALPPLAASPAPTPGSYSSFPALVTLGWSTRVKPRFATQIADRASGRSSRRPLYEAALYDIELTYDLLRGDEAHRELQEIAGFFAASGGRREPFWLAPPGLAEVFGQALGTGDGIKTIFPLVRWFGTYVEPAAATSGVAAVYLDGVLAPSAQYSVTSGYGPSIVFAAPPPSGAAIAADFGLLWLCRFSDDALDLDEFMAMLFELRLVKLQMVRP